MTTTVRALAVPQPGVVSAACTAWQGVSPNQLRLVTKNLCLVSFHEMPFFRARFPRMYVGQIVHPSGENREFLISDAGDVATLSQAFDSKLMWHSPMFFTGSPVVQRAVIEMMGDVHCVFAWCIFDDRKFVSRRGKICAGCRRGARTRSSASTAFASAIWKLARWLDRRGPRRIATWMRFF